MFLEFLHLLPFIYYIYVLIILLCFGLATEAFRYNPMKVIYSLTLFSLIMTLFIVYDEIETSISFLGQKDWIFLFGFSGLLFLMMFIFLMAFKKFMENWTWNYEYVLVCLMSIFGLIIALYSNNWILTYLGLELHSLALYVLVAMNRYSTLSLEATLKYFLLGSISSALMLLGVSFVYGACGSVDYFSISYLLLNCSLFGVQRAFLLIGFLFIVFGFFFKLAVFPFHTWAPDTYEGSIWLTAFVIAILPKFGSLLLLVKILNLFCTIFFQMEIFFRYCAIISILVGSISALYQVRLKRFLAYSSISNFGYIMLTLSIWPGVISSVLAIYFLIIYVILLGGLFGLLLNLRYVRSYLNINTFAEMGSLMYTKRPLVWAASLFVISFAGLPPLAGFWSKFFVLYWFSFGDSFGILLLLLLVSVLSAFYYLRLVRSLLNSKKMLKFFMPFSFISSLLISLFLLLNIGCAPILLYFLFIFDIF